MKFTDLGRLEGIICREMNSQEKHPSLIWTVGLQQGDEKSETLFNLIYFIPTVWYLQAPLWSLANETLDRKREKRRNEARFLAVGAKTNHRRLTVFADGSSGALSRRVSGQIGQFLGRHREQTVNDQQLRPHRKSKLFLWFGPDWDR